MLLLSGCSPRYQLATIPVPESPEGSHQSGDQSTAQANPRSTKEPEDSEELVLSVGHEARVVTNAGTVYEGVVTVIGEGIRLECPTGRGEELETSSATDTQSCWIPLEEVAFAEVIVSVPKVGEKLALSAMIPLVAGFVVLSGFAIMIGRGLGN